MRSLRGLRMAIVLAGGCLFAGAPSLHASLTLVDVFKNISYQQTSGAAPITPSGYFADVEAFMQNPGDFTSVTVRTPGRVRPYRCPWKLRLSSGWGRVLRPKGTWTRRSRSGRTAFRQTRA